MVDAEFIEDNAPADVGKITVKAKPEDVRAHVENDVTVSILKMILLFVIFMTICLLLH